MSSFCMSGLRYIDLASPLSKCSFKTGSCLAWKLSRARKFPLSSSCPLRAIFCFPQKLMASVILTSIFLWILWLFMKNSRMGSTYLHLLNSGSYGSSSSLYKNCVWKWNYFLGAADGLELTISRLSVFNVTHCITAPFLYWRLLITIYSLRLDWVSV